MNLPKKTQKQTNKGIGDVKNAQIYWMQNEEEKPQQSEQGVRNEHSHMQLLLQQT
jgi:hypothetical protein